MMHIYQIKKLFINNLFIFFILSAIIAVGFVAFFSYRNAVFSTDVLSLKITGPVQTRMGDEIEYTVTYKNNGNFVMENPTLVFMLPDNSLTEDNVLRFTQKIKDINSGEENALMFKARFLGKGGDIKNVKASLSYTPRNLSIRYESNATFSTNIDTVPLTLAYDIPSAPVKGQEITYSVQYASNVDYPLENMSIRLDPISGFNFKSSDPVSLDSNEYKLPTLTLGQSGKITITGIITAEASSPLYFAARLGMWKDGAFVTVKEATQDVQVTEPVLIVFQQINGSPNYVARAGDVLQYQISVKNAGTVALSAVPLVATLNGSAFDFSTLQSLGGQMQITNHIITFTLSNLAPNQEAFVNFSIKLKDVITDTDQVIKNAVNALGITREFTNNVSPGMADLQISLP